jgi:hypothetical protein
MGARSGRRASRRRSPEGMLVRFLFGGGVYSHTRYDMTSHAKSFMIMSNNWVMGRPLRSDLVGGKILSGHSSGSHRRRRARRMPFARITMHTWFPLAPPFPRPQFITVSSTATKPPLPSYQVQNGERRWRDHIGGGHLPPPQQRLRLRPGERCVCSFCDVRVFVHPGAPGSMDPLNACPLCSFHVCTFVYPLTPPPASEHHNRWQHTGA